MSTNAPVKVLLQTTAGNITIELRIDKPITSGNFTKIVENGKYDNTPIYRVVAGFMIQGGRIKQEPPAIPDEIGKDNHNTPYSIAMAKTCEPNSATSEFFINLSDNSKIIYPDGTSFDKTYTVFGKVTAGQDVVDAIAKGKVRNSPETGEKSYPVNPVTIVKASIVK